MTNTHTPGPWHVEPMTGDPSAIWIGNADGYTAQITREDGLAPADWADARLIAAAPAMLKALQRLTHPMADDDDLAHALDVIARATGQPIPDDTGDDEGPEPPYAGYESEAALRRMAEVRALRAKGQA